MAVLERLTESDVQAVIDATADCGLEWCRVAATHPRTVWAFVQGSLGIRDIHSIPAARAFGLASAAASWAVARSRVPDAVERQQMAVDYVNLLRKFKETTY